MSRVSLSKQEVRALHRLISEIAARYRSVEEADFLLEANVWAHEMPKRLRTALNVFRLAEPEQGLLLISGFPVDDERVGPTPEHWRRSVEDRVPTLEHEILFLLLGSLLGDCIGWTTQQDGRIVHDVLPIKGMENEQIGTGSEQTIWWHTEDAFHPLRGDYVGLMCLRNPNRVPTTFASLERVLLDNEDWQLLFEPLYTICPDNSHLARKDDGAAEKAEQFRRIEAMRQAPEKIAILSGDRRSPYIRIDPYFMDPPEELRARNALASLTQAIDRELSDIVLAPGDICFIDNFKAVHGRRAFRARYDGQDRWLKRINITRDLRKSRSYREDARSRVVQ
ncbi:MAG TPA: guanitoxin biosynthesis L-enduracididine beta-hydroxylase GntD [Thermoanaerobaculia bacterium]|jgi:Fe(II)/alpha-ketoglutarate-dependent arginine beta-hydroxylase|nr:guanitoxin biosynthesis L-enduracididine beta-hydroxylase GntD [Thermoanaerobaculia bacterium]